MESSLKQFPYIISSNNTSSSMSVLCLGPINAGKTHLLASLQHPGSVNSTSHSVPTVGTNLFSIQLPDIKTKNVTTTGTKKTTVHRTISVREVGGTMAPIWPTYLTNVEKIIYVVDTSNLCQISAAGVLLYTLLAEPRLQRTKVLVVLTKMDLAYRQMRNEALLMLQMDKLCKQIRQSVETVEASALTDIGHEQILKWLSQ